MDITQIHKLETDKVIDFLKKDVSSIRTNRANIDLVNHVMVEVYGNKTPLEQLACINAPESRLIVIQPWDKNVIKEVERALTLVDLGTTPSVSDDGIIRLKLPPLNEETRKNLVKILNSKLENARKILRSIRDNIRSDIIKAKAEKEITEDDKYRLLEELDKLSSRKHDEIRLIGERKEKEIMGLT